MSKSLLQTRIVDKLDVIMTQVDTMNKFGKNIPLIHLDILKSNIRTLYEQICELERAHMQSTNVKKPTTTIYREKEELVVSKAVEERMVFEARETISKLVESIQEDVANEYDPEIKLDFTAEIAVPTVTAPAAKVEETPLLQVETIAETIIETVVEPVVEPVVEKSVEPIAETIIETVSKTIIEPVAEPVVEERVETIIVEEKTTVQNPIPDIFSSLQTIADRYKTADSSLNEAMAISNVSTVNTAVKQIRDLKSAIGINEKFLFINELFKGNMTEYTDTIVMLSNAETLELAHEILAPVKARYEWKEDSSAYVTLIDFLQRRFV